MDDRSPVRLAGTNFTAVFNPPIDTNSVSIDRLREPVLGVRPVMINLPFADHVGMVYDFAGLGGQAQVSCNIQPPRMGVGGQPPATTDQIAQVAVAAHSALGGPPVSAYGFNFDLIWELPPALGAPDVLGGLFPPHGSLAHDVFPATPRLTGARVAYEHKEVRYQFNLGAAEPDGRAMGINVNVHFEGQQVPDVADLGLGLAQQRDCVESVVVALAARLREGTGRK